MLGNMPSNVMPMVYALLLLFYVIRAEAETHGAKIKDVKLLSDKLLKNYSKYILPSNNQFSHFNVTIYVSLRAVGEIDEIEEKLSTVMWFYFMWVDESIKWNEAKTNISYITLGWNDVWTPILRVSNPHADVTKSQNTERSYDTVIYDSNGTAYFDEMMSTRTTCDLDMTYYPFDIQSCDIEMLMVGAQHFWFNLDVSVHKGFSVDDAKHGAWRLLNKSISVKEGTFKIELMFRRRPMFLLLNILLPIIVLALLTPIVFVLPKKSGERVGYAITMLLAISVYMTIVSDHLPQNSQPLPLASIMMFIWYILDALIVFVVIINTKINTTSDSKPLSYVSRKFVILTRKLTSILTCQTTKKETGDDSSDETDKCIDMETIDKKDDTSKTDENQKVNPNMITWRDLSHSVDKWCFVISYLFKIGLPIIFLSISKAHSHEALD